VPRKVATSVAEDEGKNGSDGDSGADRGNGHESIGQVGEALGEGEAEIKC